MSADVIDGAASGPVAPHGSGGEIFRPGQAATAAPDGRRDGAPEGAAPRSGADGAEGLDRRRRPYNTATGLGDTGRVTSKKAAAKAAGQADALRKTVFGRVADAQARGMTGSELATALSLPVTSVRPRLTELFNAGRIVVQKRSDDLRGNLNRRNGQGSMENVWVLPAFLRRAR